MAAGQLLLALTIGAAALALWSYLRWPGAMPASFKGALLRVAIALLLLQAGAPVLELGVDRAATHSVAIVVGVVVPVLTYAFLASIWFLKVCADQVRGAA